MRAANIDREIEPLHRLRAVAAAGRGGDDRGGGAWRGTLPLLPEHAGTLLVPGVARLDLHGFHSAHRPRQGHLAGLRLPDPGERHLPVRPAAHPLDAAAGGVGNPAGPHRGRVRHRHHRGPDPAGVRLARHPQTDRAPRMRELLLIFVPLAGAAAGGRLAERADAPLAAARGRRSCTRRWPSGCCAAPPAVAPGAWFGFDPLARAVLPDGVAAVSRLRGLRRGLPADTRRSARTGCSSPRCWRSWAC